MKHIVLVMGMGLNERGWAGLLSRFGRVILIQVNLLEHVEIWEGGQRIYCGPEISRPNFRGLDAVLLGAITMLRTLVLVMRHTKGVKVDLLIAAAYSPVVAALLLRLCGKAKKVVSFVTDYLPVQGTFAQKCHRFIARWLTSVVSRLADQAWALSPRIHTVRSNPHHFVVPMWVSDNHAPIGQRDEVAYIGFPSHDHALDLLFAICAKHKFRLNIIGDSPYLQSVKHSAPPGTVFHGLLNDETRIHEILTRCFCGYAIYRNTGPTSYSYYGFPSKTLYCFASNAPIVITNVAHANEIFEKRGVGRVVEPVPEKIEEAILQLKEQYPLFYTAINRFRGEWNQGVEQFHRERLSELWDEELNPGVSAPAREESTCNQ